MIGAVAGHEGKDGAAAGKGAFQGEPEIKSALERRVIRAKLERWAGCDLDGVGLVGAIAGKYDRDAAARELGVPIEVIDVAEVLFDEAPEGWKKFPLALVQAVEPGADYNGLADGVVSGLMRAVAGHVLEGERVAWTEALAEIGVRNRGIPDADYPAAEVVLQQPIVRLGASFAALTRRCCRLAPAVVEPALDGFVAACAARKGK